LPRHFLLTVAAAVDEINSWRPRGCTKETDYRDSLYDKLQDAFRIPPTKEFGHGVYSADIAFERKLAIELKKDLREPTKLQRLKGQIEDMSKTFTNSIVVLVGETRSDLLKDLRGTANKYNVTVVEK
jgi:hypothetical protein